MRRIKQLRLTLARPRVAQISSLGSTGMRRTIIAAVALFMSPIAGAYDAQ
jgi:hypothetical protein